MISATIPLTIPFHDVDVLMVAWHGHYVKYCELARTALTRKLEMDWPDLQKRNLVMPVIHFSCDYRSPLCYGAEYEIEASVEDPTLPKFSVTYRFREKGKQESLCMAHSDQVYIKIDSKELLFSLPVELQEHIAARLEQPASQNGGTQPTGIFWRPE
jgi:acyl-CoA thioester hydrolase